MSRVIVVSELFYPDGTSTAHILTKIADHLYNEHEILVLAGPKSYGSDKINGQTLGEKHYPIKRVAIGEYDKNKLRARALRLFSTSFKLGILLWRNSKKDDDILIVTNPAPFLIIASIIRKIRGFNLNILVHDVFPENAVAAGVIKSNKNLAYKIVRYLFSKAYQSSDNIIVLGRDMKEIFEEKFKRKRRKPNIRIIENWADPLPANFNSKQNTDNTIRILYAGNIGRCQGLEHFLKIYKKAANPNVQFLLRGGGAIVPEIKKSIVESDSKIILGGTYSRDEQFEILSECDIALVTLADGMYGLGVPSKSYNIMAAGKPILFIGDPTSEIALTIKEKNLGYIFDTLDEAGLEAWLSTLSAKCRSDFEIKGANALKAAATDYSEKMILSKYSNLFSK